MYISKIDYIKIIQVQMHSDRHQASGSEATSGAPDCVSMSEAGVDALFSNLSSACSSQIWP